MAKLSTDDYKITINGTDFSDHLTGCDIPLEVNTYDSTAFGMGWMEHVVSPVKGGSVTLAWHQDYGAASVDATLFPLLGSAATVVATPTSGSVTSTNPSYTAVCSVTQYSPIAGNFGALATFNTTWPTNGTVSRGTA